MQRSRLKNIVNKSKKIGKGDFFEMFKKDLPSNYDFYKDDNNYRLKEAWESYGKPKSFEEAQQTGLVLGNVLASIGYNEDTNDYEYLNKGYENDSVNRDIRVWEEDMIPLVQELKNGGYLRVFDEEKNFWTYTKNPQKKEQYLENKQELINKFQKGGKSLEDKKRESDEKNFTPTQNEINQLINLVYRSDANFAKRLADPERKMLDFGDGEVGSHKLAYATPEEGPLKGRVVVYPEIQELDGNLVDLSGNHMAAFDTAVRNKDYIVFPSEELAGWFTNNNYKHYFPGLEQYAPQGFKQGGQMNVIPEGALHARKNNMEGGGKDYTHKGIPVMTKDGEQVAEIEKEEIIFNKSFTDFIEEKYKAYKEDKDDDIAISVGKRLVKEIFENTDDRTGLIDEIENKL